MEDRKNRLEDSAGNVLEKILYGEGLVAGFIQEQLFTTANILPNYLLHRYERARIARIAEKRQENNKEIGEINMQDNKAKARRYRLGGWAGIALDITAAYYAGSYTGSSHTLASEIGLVFWNTKALTQIVSGGLLITLFGQEYIKKKINKQDKDKTD
jgi:hypothetical protein